MNTQAETTFENVAKFLQKIVSNTGKEISVYKVAMDTNAPYRNQLAGALVNLNLTTWVKSGVYRVNKFYITPEVINTVITTCKELIPKVNYKPRNKNTLDSPVVKSYNPFGLDSFSTIMVEKGSMVIGEYLLEGNFTITKIKNDD